MCEIGEMAQPVTDDTRKLAELVSEGLKKNVESANKSANKSANSVHESAVYMKGHNQRQTQILAITEDGREYTTEGVAALIGLKGPRTRQLMNELVELGKLERLGTTKDRRYRIK